MRLRARVLLQAILLIAWIVLPLRVRAQGTKQWTVNNYDQFQRGTADGVAIRNDGRLEPGLTFSVVYSASESYVWSVAESTSGLAYAGLGGSTGGSAAIMRLSPNGVAEKIFAGKELAVQAVKVAPDGSVFAATSPDGKVYHLSGSGDEVIFDPGMVAEKPKYLWDIAICTRWVLVRRDGRTCSGLPHPAHDA